MYKIIKNQTLTPQIKLMEVEAPLVAKKAEPGQFIVLKINETGERIPLTIHDKDPITGIVSIIFQEIGKTTMLLGSLNPGEYIMDFVGPLGLPTELNGYNKVAIIGGGLGTAIAYPQAKKLKSLGSEVYAIIGARNKDLIILEQEMDKVSDKLFVTTDDGSNGHKGFVTDVLQQLIDEGTKLDLVIAIGPLIMMKVVSELTRKFNIKTIVSMNPIMIDGTGMCGGCRITVAGKVRFACVEGPDFDGHDVDFDEAMRRQIMYREEECISKKSHQCRLLDQ